MTTPTDLPQTSPTVRWPTRHHPSDALAYASTETIAAAPLETVWATLVRAADWPQWFAEGGPTHFLSHAGPHLRDRSRFRTRALGVSLTCKVREFEPCNRLAWDAHGPGIDAYQAWVLTALEDGRTHILTEETRTGWLTRVAGLVRPQALERRNGLWVQALAARTAQVAAA